MWLSVLSIVLSGIMGSVALVAAMSSGSLSLLGFGFDAAIDAVASVALVWRFAIEARQPHQGERVERIAETSIGAVLLALAAYLAVNAADALATGTSPDSTIVGTALLLVSLAILPPLAVAKNRTAARLESGALRADSLLTAFAALLALISVVGLSASEVLGAHWADAIGALLVTVVLARQGISSLRAFRAPAGALM
jgi:divalent metal cation (Fe/Co/Zn/Cd) transporter